MTSQLAKLAKPIPEAYVKVKPTGRGDRYVSHGDITQFLLAHLGPFDMRIVELIRSPEGIVEGCILECTFSIDGRVTTCLLYTSPSPRDVEESRMPSSA